jgi:hypothetical protein
MLNPALPAWDVSPLEITKVAERLRDDLYAEFEPQDQGSQARERAPGPTNLRGAKSDRPNRTPRKRAP